MKKLDTMSWVTRLLAGLLFVPVVHAATCKFNLTPANPDAAYIVNTNGTVIDTRSNLMWQACNVGQAWSGSACTGTASQLTWDAALSAGVASNFAGFADWRLPNLKELSSIVETCTDSPTINATIFPSGIGAGYWSSSPTKQLSSTDLSWMINFQFATTNQNARYIPGYVRLVRNFSAQAQTITGPTFGGTLAVRTSATVSATASSGLPVTITSATPAVCSVTGSPTTSYTVAGLTAGTCTVTATQSGNLYYSSATPTQASTTVAQGTQTIGAITATSGATTVTKIAIGSTATLSATASSGLAVTFGASPSNICTIAGNVVTGVAAGTCNLTANQAGDANNFAAPQVTGTLTVLLNQAITFAAPAITAGQSSALAATTTATPAINYPVTFSTTTPTQCSVTGDINAGFSVNGLIAGTSNCTIVASQAGDNTYAPAADVIRTVSVAQGTQTIGAITLSAPITVGATVTATATASSGLPVSIVAGPSNICTNNGNLVTGVSVGFCTLVASQSGNVNFQAAPTQLSDFYVGKGAQSIGAITASNGTGVTTKVAIGATVTLSATATSGLAVTSFGAGPVSVCTISGNVVTGVSAGTCNLTADQAGSANYLAAPQATGSITVLAAQTITFGPPSVAVGQTVALSASTTATGASYPITFATTTPTACTVGGNTVTGFTLTGVAAGTSNCTVVASQPGDSTYAPATPVTQTLSVAKGSQSVSAVTFSTPSVGVGKTVTLSATASSGLAVTYGANPANICTVSGNVLTGVAPGGCNVTADQAGNANYLAATQQTATINVLQSQTITFSAPSGQLSVGGNLTLSATTTATPSGTYPITFISLTLSACTVSGTTVTGVSAGTNNCIVVARQDGDATYAPATSVQVTLSVAKGNQTISSPITFTPTAVPVGGTATPGATASSGLMVTFTSTTPTICTVAPVNGVPTITGVAAGTCSITASQPGDANYNAATPVTTTVQAKVFAQFSPASLTFGNQTLNTTSAAQTITLTNNGPVPLTVTSISTTLTDFVTTNAGTCTAGSPLAPLAACTFSVTFTPPTTGSRIGSLRVTTDEQAALATHLLSLSGTGVMAAPTCTLVAAPTHVTKSGSATLTASCPTATSYTWTGGACAGLNTATCTVTPTATTTYTVTGTNAGGTSPVATATVTVGTNLIPILMLLLD